MPKSRLTDWLTARPIAHRGLHDGNRNVPENSLEAARRAIAAGFSIECDVHLSGDRVPVVFHDDTLNRMTTEDGLLASRPVEGLTRLALAGTSERIPTVEHFLDVVGGSVPVVMELKGTSPDADRDVLRVLAPLLDTYHGELALMSFDGWLIEQALGYGRRPVGLTAEGIDDDVLAEHKRLFDLGCAFVSYNVDELANSFVRYVREARDAPVLTWTVKTPDAVRQTRLHADQMTFEGFLPHE